MENEDDLWHLKDMIGPGDRVSAVTQRTKLDGREKKTLKLTVETEKTELEGNRLRVTGEMKGEYQDVEIGYHTLNITSGNTFEISSDFTDEEWERLQELENRESYEVVFALIESGSVEFFRVRESGIEEVSSVTENVPGKMYESEGPEKFRKKAADAVEKAASKEVNAVVLAGPGFEKDRVQDLLPDRTDSKVMTQDTSLTGRRGLQEAINRGALERVVKESRVSDESKAVNEFLERLRDGDQVEYGEAVREAAKMGAVAKLILTVEARRESPGLVEEVEQKGGEVEVVHTDHELGERLENFGGKAALLRYDV